MRRFLPLLMLFAAPVLAAPLPVSYETGVIFWDAPSAGDFVTVHTVYCAPISGGSAKATVIDMPLLGSTLKQVLPAPGAYTCTYTRSNVVGESGVSPASVPFVATQGPSAVPSSPTSAPKIGAGG